MNLAAKLGLLALAGAAGTLSRFGISTLSVRLFGTAFPFGTLAVNLAGCFLFGWFWALAAERRLVGDEARLIILTGFLGGLTTFSSFAFESSDLLRKNQWGLAALNVLLENGLGIAAVFAGLALGRWR